MQVLTNSEALRPIHSNIVFALGTFDGLHRGHLAVIREAVGRARACDGIAVVLTFNAHPLSILAPEKVPPALIDAEGKLRILEAEGIGCTVRLPLSKSLLDESAESFAERLLSHPGIRAVVTGSNFTFGHEGLGNPDMLRRMAEGRGIDIVSLPLETDAATGRTISSTAVRRAIVEGHMSEAAAMLGRPYGFTGTVIEGDKRGRTLGYPTLNFMIPDGLATPADGVYANRVYIDGVRYDGVGNVGDNPTFDNQYHRAEVHVFDFDRDVYGKRVYVEFYERLRGETRFDSLDALVAQMQEDEMQAKRVLSEKTNV